jgi:hypothetical protein
MVLGKDVILIEEEGFYKIRVTRLNKSKITGYLEHRNTSDSRVESNTQLPAADTTVNLTSPRDTIYT